RTQTPGRRGDHQAAPDRRAAARAPGTRSHVFRHLLFHDGLARCARADRDHRVGVAALARAQGSIRAALLRPHRLRRALLASGRPDLDLPLSAPVLDSLASKHSDLESWPIKTTHDRNRRGTRPRHPAKTRRMLPRHRRPLALPKRPLPGARSGAPRPELPRPTIMAWPTSLRSSCWWAFSER